MVSPGVPAAVGPGAVGGVDAEYRLEADGVPLVEDLDEAWSEFVKLREMYEPYVLGLCELILPPPAPWCAANR